MKNKKIISMIMSVVLAISMLSANTYCAQGKEKTETSAALAKSVKTQNSSASFVNTEGVSSAKEETSKEQDSKENHETSKKQDTKEESGTSGAKESKEESGTSDAKESKEESGASDAKDTKEDGGTSTEKDSTKENEASQEKTEEKKETTSQETQTTASQIFSDHAEDFSLCNSKGEGDSTNIGAFARQGSSRVYNASVNLEKVRLQMKASAGENQVFQAELTDSSGKEIDSFFYAGGEDGDSTVLQSKVMNLEEGDNVFYLNCHGTYVQYIGAEKKTGSGIYTFTFHIYRNKKGDPETNNTVSLENLGVYINDLEGKNYITEFSPETKKYTITLSEKDFDEAISENNLWMTVKEGDPNQEIKIYGKSTLNGISAGNLKQESNGAYNLGKYQSKNLFSSDSFTTKIKILAADHITTKEYEIKVEKKGKTGIVIPDIYRETSFYIVPSQPERKMVLVYGSITIYDEGEKINGSQAIMDGRLTIDIKNTDIISMTGKKTGAGFIVWLNSPGTTKVNIVYDDGKLHYENEVQVSVYYSASYLQNEISVAEKLLSTTKKSDRVYMEGAQETFSNAIKAAKNVYSRYGGAGNQSADNMQKITDAATALIKAEDVYKRSEIGKKITGFVALADSVATQNVENGKSILNVNRPKKINAIIDGKIVTISNVKWTSRPTWQVKTDEEIVYRFTPELPAGYVVAPGVDYPVITVYRKARTLAVEVKRTISLPDSVLVQRVPYGTKKAELNLPSSLEMYQSITAGDEGGRISIPVRWKDVDGYNGKVAGTYSFRSVINASSSEYKLAANTSQEPMQTIRVIVEEPEDGQGNGSGNGNGNGTGNGSGNGSGTGIGNGTGDGMGNGSGSGTGDGSGIGSGTKNKEGNGTENGNGGKKKNGGTGGVGNRKTAAKAGDSGEASGKDKDTEETAGGSSGGGMKGNDKAKTSSKKSGGKGKEKTNKKWKVKEIVKEAVVSNQKEWILLVTVLGLLLLLGGYREYRRHTDEKKKR